MAVVGALTMEGHESRRTKQLKFCGNINIKSGAERTGSDGCLLRHREGKKVWTLAGVDNPGGASHLDILKKKKKKRGGIVWARRPAPTPTPD